MGVCCGGPTAEQHFAEVAAYGHYEDGPLPESYLQPIGKIEWSILIP